MRSRTPRYPEYRHPLCLLPAGSPTVRAASIIAEDDLRIRPTKSLGSSALHDCFTRKAASPMEPKRFRGTERQKTIIDIPNANFLAKLSSKFRVLSQSHQGRSAPLLRPMPRQMLPSSQRLRTVFISVWERMYVRATGLKAEKHGVKGH